MDEILCCNCEISLSIKNDLYIRCENCRKKGCCIYLCAECFRMGAECGPHKRHHAYTVEDLKGPPLFCSNGEKQWGWKEDMKLITIVHKHKLGNWDEIASALNTDKTSDEVKNHFDRYFIRGSIGRYAADFAQWPSIDDRTIDEASALQCHHDLSGIGRMTPNPRWKYVIDYFRNWQGTVDFNDINWFNSFENDLLKCQSELNSPPSLSPAVKSDLDADRSFERRVSPLMISPPSSPVEVEFTCENDGCCRKRLLSSSDFDDSGGEESSYSESNNSYVDSEHSSHKHLRKISLYEAHSGHDENTSNCNGANGVQSTDEEGSDDSEKRKPILRLKRVERRWRSKRERNEISKKCLNEKLEVKISDDAKQRLREMYPEQFFANSHAPPMSAEERAKLKDDDLQLIAYMPERGDFEWEFNNDAERLISRLILEEVSENDDDDLFENAVKMAKVQKYNRVLKQRRAKKAVVREYDLVNKFFDKLKKIAEKRRGLIYSHHGHMVSHQQQRMRVLLNKTYQVATRSELQKLISALFGYSTLNERIIRLKSLKANGINNLKDQKKINEGSPRKKKRHTYGGNEMQRRANLRWVRFKRWSMQQVNEFGSAESDV